MNVFIIGATGETGSRIARQLVMKGHQVHALHRQPHQHDQLAAMGVVPHLGDLVTISTQALVEAMDDCDVVVFTAGANGGGDEMTDAIDGRGVELASTSAKLAGISRFVLVSAFPDAWREKRMPPDFEHYMFVKRQADVFLVATELDWVIVRPGTLLNVPGSGKVRAGVAIPYGEVSRDDVATFIVATLENNKLNRVIVELTEGKTPVVDAVHQIAQFSPHHHE